MLSAGAKETERSNPRISESVHKQKNTSKPSALNRPHRPLYRRSQEPVQRGGDQGGLDGAGDGLISWRV